MKVSRQSEFVIPIDKYFPTLKILKFIYKEKNDNRQKTIQAQRSEEKK